MATTYTWTAGTTGNWSTSDFWTPTGTPGVTGNTDIAVLPSFNGVYTVTLSGGYDIATLEIAGHNGTPKATNLIINGDLTAATLDFNGSTDSTGRVGITINSGGLFDITTAILTADNKDASTVTIAGTASKATLELGSTSVGNSNIAYDYSNNATGISYGLIDYASGYTVGTTLTQTITDASWGDQIEFAGTNFTGDTFTYTASSGTLVLKRFSTTELTIVGITGTSTLTAADFTITNGGNTIEIVCYAAGTRIMTPTGGCMVEDLRPGDSVLTVAGDEFIARPVKWLGRRRIDIAAHPLPRNVAPVRIREGAFADSVPHRDLLVSPDHGIFVGGMLIAARQLINGTTIAQDLDATSVEYFHVELDRHAILLAEGLAAESYLDTDNRGFFANSGEPMILHPNLRDESDYPNRAVGSCHPFVIDAEQVRPIWQVLADRAAALGEPVPAIAATEQLEPSVYVRGKLQRPLTKENGLFTFVVPCGTTEVQLASCAFLPTDMRPWLDDRRRLGVNVQRIVLRNATEFHDIPLDNPALSKGWWEVERSGATVRRWTDGMASLPLPPIGQGPAILELWSERATTCVSDAEPYRAVA